MVEVITSIIASLAAGSGLTVLTKYLMDSRRESAQQPIDQYEGLVDRLEKRIVVLEQEHKQCLEAAAKTQLELGKLQGMLAEQREGLNHLRETNTRQSLAAVKQAGEVAAKAVVTAATLVSNSPVSQQVNNEHPFPVTIIDGAEKQS